MSTENPPPSDDDLREKQRARQKSSVLFACSLLVLVGIAVLVLPLEKIPRPIRFVMAGGDFIAASALWLIARQKFGK